MRARVQPLLGARKTFLLPPIAASTHTAETAPLKMASPASHHFHSTLPTLTRVLHVCGEELHLHPPLKKPCQGTATPRALGAGPALPTPREPTAAARRDATAELRLLLSSQASSPWSREPLFSPFSAPAAGIEATSDPTGADRGRAQEGTSPGTAWLDAKRLN